MKPKDYFCLYRKWESMQWTIENRFVAMLFPLLYVSPCPRVTVSVRLHIPPSQVRIRHIEPYRYKLNRDYSLWQKL